MQVIEKNKKKFYRRLNSYKYSIILGHKVDFYKLWKLFSV